MDALRQYVISVVAAAIVCGIVTGVMKEGTAQAVVKLICGLFLTFAVLRPIARLDLADLGNFGLSLSRDAEQAAAVGENLARDALADIIKRETEAYILDKAAALNLSLEAEVTVSDSDPPVPMAVRISGNASPYARLRLQNLIQEELGISKENQLWTG